ncbi:MAG TPA: S53 family peptidase [Myxococcales bacterium]|jgi:kumamolisin
MAERRIFHDSVAALPQNDGVSAGGLRVAAAAPADRDALMSVHFALSLPNGKQADLEAAVARGDVLPAAEVRKNYAADSSQVTALKTWLTDQGFEITHVASDGTGIYARATAAQIEKSLAVQIVRVTKDGVVYPSARNAPSLPAEIAGGVHAITGLQPFVQARKHSVAVVPRRAHARTPPGPPKRAAVEATAALAPVPNLENAPPYIVPEILKAYGADGVGVTGDGQTIAILIDTVPARSDLNAFWKRNGLTVTDAQVTFVNVGGGTLPKTEGEETLDVEWTSGIAPGANIRVYASGSLSFDDLNLALDRIFDDLDAFPSMRQLSISLGLGERFLPPDVAAAQHSHYVKLAAAGVNVFVSTGDAGSDPDETGHGHSGHTQAEYPSSDAAVVAVGGTSLTLAPDGTVAREVGWTEGGGGSSRLRQGRPPWQKGPGVDHGNTRLVPDVSAAADPDLGAFVFFNGSGAQIGGTSWSAPVWAGFCALLNEARAKAGKPLLPFLNPLLYPLIESTCFRDIISGSNGAYSAGPGHDLVTGIGVPHVGNLIAQLT